MDLDKLFNDNLINKYFYDKLKKGHSFSVLPDDLKNDYISDIIDMSKNDVSNFEDQKLYLFISMHAPEIIEKLTGSVLFTNDVVSSVYKYAKKHHLENFMDLYDAVRNVIKELGIPLKDEQRKLAYPQGFDPGIIQEPYNISRWMEATEDIYLRAKNGEDFNRALKEVTKDFSVPEKVDYQAWLRFYQQGGNRKYKMATSPSEFDFYLKPTVPYSSLKAELPRALTPEYQAERERNEAEDAHRAQLNAEIAEEERLAKEEQDKNSARDRIEGHRNKVVGRLNSAEKLLTSLDGQFFAGEEQEMILRLLQDLKRKIQTANKLNVKSSLFEDYIYRTGNYLKSIGNKKGAGFFYKIAQEAPNPNAPVDLLEGLSEAPKGDADPSIEETMKGLEELPEGGGLEVSEDDLNAPAENNETAAAFKNFKELLETGVDIPDEVMGVSDGLKLSFAQMGSPGVQAPKPAPMAKKEPMRANPDGTNEQVEHEVAEDGEDAKKDRIDAELDKVYDSATVQDVIKRLELMAAFIKQRSMVSELLVSDQILNRLGIASYFPELAECERSVLESGSYVGTRIDTMLARLRGTVYSGKADQMFNKELKEDAVTTPLQQGLQKEQDDERARKERRKANEDAKQDAVAIKREQGTEEPSPIAEQMEGKPAPQVQAPAAPIARPE